MVCERRRGALEVAGGAFQCGAAAVWLRCGSGVARCHAEVSVGVMGDAGRDTMLVCVEACGAMVACGVEGRGEVWVCERCRFVEGLAFALMSPRER